MVRKKIEPPTLKVIFSRRYSKIEAYHPCDGEGKPIKRVTIIRLEEATNQPVHKD